MNLAILVGTVSSEIRKYDVGKASVTKFRVKTTEVFTVDGEQKERSQTHLIDVWNAHLQKTITPYLKTGQMVEIQGMMESRNMAKQGEPARWTTTIVLRNGGIISVFGGQGSNMATTAQAGEEPKLNVDHSRHVPEPIGNEDDGLGDDVPF